MGPTILRMAYQCLSWLIYVIFVYSAPVQAWRACLQSRRLVSAAVPRAIQVGSQIAVLSVASRGVGMCWGLLGLYILNIFEYV